MAAPRLSNWLVAKRSGGGLTRGRRYKRAVLRINGVRVAEGFEAEREGLVRVVDDSGEDYLHPKDLFRPATAADLRTKRRR